MSHIRSPRPDHPETNGVSGTTHNLRVLADGQSPASGLTENVVCKLRGRDFDFRGGSQGNVPPFQFVVNENFNVVDAMAIANRARALQARELRRLFAAAVAWATNAAARWTARNRQRRHLSKLSDHLLRDIGIRPNQINDLVSGSLKRGNGQ